MVCWALWAAVVDRLRAGDALGAAAVGACRDAQRDVDDDALADVAMLLSDLEQRGVLLTRG